MKKSINYFISKYYYPQYYFSKKVLKFINEDAENKIIVDAPCGIGQTTYWIAYKKPKSKVFGYDISVNDIKVAKENFVLKNIFFKEDDIFDVMSQHHKIDYFLMINSLFLLPDPERLLSEIKKSLTKEGKLILVIPNTEGENYLYFKKNNPHVNQLEISKGEIKNYFQEIGFKVDLVKGLSFVAHYKNKLSKKISILSHFYLIGLNWWHEIILRSNKPNYFLIILKKS